MSDITNIPKFSDVLKDYGFKTGALIDQRFAALDADRQQKLDAAIATLSGQDTQVMSVINQLQRLTDAQPGTPEFDEGQNLYQLMQTNYLALDDRLTANEALATALNTWKSAFVTDYTATIQRIDAAITAEVSARQAEITRLEGLINTNNDALAAANAARVALAARLDATDASQTDDINALKTRMTSAEMSIATYGEQIATLQSQMQSRVQEISTLQTKQNELESRVSMLESKFEGLNVAAAVSEFYAGLTGDVSPGGYSAYVPPVA